MAEPKTIGRRSGGGAQLRLAHPLRWDEEIQQGFLAELARTANVTASARAVGMSEKTAYRHRAQDASFRAAWAAALDDGYAKLETMLLGRAMNGTFKAVWYGGKKVGRTKEYSDRLALQLLAVHRAAVMDGRRGSDPADVVAVRARIEEKLAEMNRRLGGEG